MLSGSWLLPSLLWYLCITSRVTGRS